MYTCRVKKRMRARRVAWNETPVPMKEDAEERSLPRPLKSVIANIFPPSLLLIWMSRRVPANSSGSNASIEPLSFDEWKKKEVRLFSRHCKDCWSGAEKRPLRRKASSSSTSFSSASYSFSSCARGEVAGPCCDCLSPATLFLAAKRDADNAENACDGVVDESVVDGGLADTVAKANGDDVCPDGEGGVHMDRGRL